MKLISWNVNGIRAWQRKGLIEWFKKESPDFLCIQETKAEKEQLSKELLEIDGYYIYFNSSNERKGYSGTAIYTKHKPEKITYGLGNKILDQQGRQINIFYKKTLIINTYFPNGGGTIPKLLYKLDYFQAFNKFINKYKDQGYNVIFCGDVNIAHNEIDLARPENNKNEVGFLPEERIELDEIIQSGFVDTFRELHPDKVQYSWWDMKTRARDRNVGWRLDYVFTDKKTFKKVKDSYILDEVLGSDHCPVVIDFELKL